MELFEKVYVFNNKVFEQGTAVYIQSDKEDETGNYIVNQNLERTIDVINAKGELKTFHIKDFTNAGWEQSPRCEIHILQVSK